MSAIPMSESMLLSPIRPLLAADAPRDLIFPQDAILSRLVFSIVRISRIPKDFRL